jgi:hypothetical protein
MENQAAFEWLQGKKVVVEIKLWSVEVVYTTLKNQE